MLCEPPFRSVSELAEALGCNRRTLWRHWRLAIGAGVILRLEDVLDWILLLHAAGHKSLGRSWSQVASELQVHPHTLARAAARLARRSLRALTAVSQLTLAGEFDAQLVTPLLALSSRDVLR
jgi:AcrR family transcriptional regulator